MQFIDLKTQYAKLKTEITEKINTVLAHGQYIMGPEVSELEEQLASYVGVKHAIGVSNGTDALLIALMALDIKPGDEVITTAFSFVASASVIALVGATPIFVDIDPHTYNIDPSLIEAAITTKTKAIITVDLYGLCADYDAINAIANRYQIPVIEDAAQSFGASYKNRKAGSLTAIGCTSFFPSKPLGCYGDGGAIFTNDNELANLIHQIRQHGADKRYHHVRLGINGRLDTLQAAILLAKLTVFDDEVQQRQKVGQYYQALLSPHFKTQQSTEHQQPIYAQFTLEVKKRDKIAAKLNEVGIPTAVHYPCTLTEQPLFNYLHLPKNICQHAVNAANNVLSLPMHPYLTNEQIDMIVHSLLQVSQSNLGES